MSRGKFIVVEGGEGSGKSTLVKYAKEIFPEMLTTREPGGSPFAEKIRSVILSPDAKDASGETQFGLFWAARFDHIKNTILPALSRGQNVLCDRFDSSSFVYQMYGQEAHELKDLFWKVRDVYLRDAVPDMYVFIDVNPEEGLRRAASRKGEYNHFDARKIDFHQRLREGYKDFLRHVPHKIIDANRPLEEVKANFKDVLLQLLKK